LKLSKGKRLEAVHCQLLTQSISVSSGWYLEWNLFYPMLFIYLYWLVYFGSWCVSIGKDCGRMI
jgi:hypothetical protein